MTHRIWFLAVCRDLMIAIGAHLSRVCELCFSSIWFQFRFIFLCLFVILTSLSLPSLSKGGIYYNFPFCTRFLGGYSCYELRIPFPVQSQTILISWARFNHSLSLHTVHRDFWFINLCLLMWSSDLSTRMLFVAHHDVHVLVYRYLIHGSHCLHFVVSLWCYLWFYSLPYSCEHLQSLLSLFVAL